MKNQKITFDKEMNLKLVEVIDEEGITQIKFVVKNLNMKADLNKEIFLLSNNIKSGGNKTEESASLEEVLYPTYLPLNTTFKSQETISKENKERVILTFAGEKSFILVEEVSAIKNDMEVISVYGDIALVDDTLGAITDTSVMWHKGNIEYYISSQNLTSEELIKVASSTITAAVTK